MQAVLAVSDWEASTELSAEKTQMHTRACFTKAELKFMQTFDESKPLQVTRPAIQTAMKELRAGIGKGKEREALHPVLYEKVMSTWSCGT